VLYLVKIIIPVKIKNLFSFPKNDIRVVFAKFIGQPSSRPAGFRKNGVYYAETIFLLMTIIGLQKDYDLAPYHSLTPSHQQFKVICDLIFVLKSFANVNCFDFDEKNIRCYIHF